MTTRQRKSHDLHGCPFAVENHRFTGLGPSCTCPDSRRPSYCPFPCPATRQECRWLKEHLAEQAQEGKAS